MRIKLILLCFVFSTSILIAQNTIVKGKVVDNSGVAIIGATIQVKNNDKNGVETDFEGKFKIKTPIDTVLIISYLGMKSQEVKAKLDLIITLEESQELLEVVTIQTGYQKVKKNRMTGSVSTINSEEIKNINFTSIDQVLQGNISGLTAVTSGKPGADVSFSIRGINSLSGSSNPIWIVDGMPLQGEVPNLEITGGGIDKSLFSSGIGNISPDDILSITVLKDAAAAAIYGARAANGVIVVETKSGKIGKPSYSITVNSGLTSRPESNVKMMNSTEKIQFEREVYNDVDAYTGRVGYILKELDRGVLSKTEADARIKVLENTNTDWFKELYREALSTQVSASVSGGSDRTQYYSSMNFLKENGIEYNNKYNRFVFSTKLKHKIHKKLEVETKLSVAYRKNRSSAGQLNTLSYALFANPYESASGYDQSWVMSRSSIRDGFKWTTFNAKNEIMKNTFTSRYISANLITRLKWKIMKGLSFTSQAVVGVDSKNTSTVHGAGTYTDYVNNWLNFNDNELLPSSSKGSLKEGTSYSNSYTWRNMVEFDKKYNNQHFINLMLGQEISDRISNASSNYSPIFDEEHRIVGFPQLSKETEIKKINFNKLGSTGQFQSKLSSFFLNGSYSYEDRYVLAGSVRYDGSDIIGNNNQFTPLWNVSTRWNLHKEPYFDVSFINELSLRAGYGYTGSIDKNAFPFVIMRLGSNQQYDNMITPESFSFANPNVKWQTKRDINVGFQTSMFNRRLLLGLNYYNNFVFDLLDRKSLPLSSGRPNVIENVANIVNKGFEIDLGFDIIKKPEFLWRISGNIAINKSEILNTYHENLESLPTGIEQKRTYGSGYFVEGFPVSSWYGYKFAGVDPTTGHTMVYDQEGKKFDMDLVQNATLGLKTPTPYFLGEFSPPITGGFSSKVNWKRWFFTTNFQFSTGNYIKSFNTFRGLGNGNRYFKDGNRWRAPGDIALIPEVSQSLPAYAKYMYDVMLEKGDYLRNTNTSIGYNMPQGFLDNVGLSNARMTLGAYNLFTLTAYKGIDPALRGGTGYPITRRYSLTLNFGF